MPVELHVMHALRSKRAELAGTLDPARTGNFCAAAGDLDAYRRDDGCSIPIFSRMRSFLGNGGAKVLLVQSR